MLSINTIARVAVNVTRSAAQPTAWDTGLLLVKDASFTAAKRLRSYASSAEAAAGLIADGFSSSTRLMIPPRYLLTLAQSVSKCQMAFAITPANTATANRSKV